MTVIAIQLTPSTIGQFQEGDVYGVRGVVKKVLPTELKVCVADNVERCKECTNDCPVRPKRSVEEG